MAVLKSVSFNSLNVKHFIKDDNCIDITLLFINDYPIILMICRLHQ